MQSTLPKVPGASPRARRAQRQPGDSYADAAVERKPEQVVDWSPPDVAQWLYTQVRHMATDPLPAAHLAT